MTATVTPREIEKLKALGYEVRRCFGRLPHTDYWAFFLPGIVGSDFVKGEDAAWAAARTHARSPAGMAATMAAKVRWLLDSHDGFHIENLDIGRWPDGSFAATAYGTKSNSKVSWNGEEAGGGTSPEAAVDALFWEVP